MNSAVWLYADRLPPLIGGMEMHARYFIEHFDGHASFPLDAIISKDGAGRDFPVRQPAQEPRVIFFNSGRWIEEVASIRRAHPKALLVYRTGGNEVLKAPLVHANIKSHVERQAYWAATLNDSIDLLVTNSAFTEGRLRSVGVRCQFLRCVGGVNMTGLQHLPLRSEQAKLFCAARYVPYKQHERLLAVVARLLRRGYDLRLRLAGDGPLEPAVRARAAALGIADRVDFLGAMSNEAVCAETAGADAYVQLSADLSTEVPGGSYTHSEGMGRSILEAVSVGTFVIAGRSGALPEVVSPERGLLLDLGESDDVLADQISRVLLSRPRPEPTEEFAWRHIFARYEQSWEDLLATAGRN